MASHERNSLASRSGAALEYYRHLRRRTAPYRIGWGRADRLDAHRINSILPERRWPDSPSLAECDGPDAHLSEKSKLQAAGVSEQFIYYFAGEYFAL